MRRVIYSFLSNIVMMSRIFNESSLSEVLSGEIRNINSFLTYKCYRTSPAKQIYVFIVLYSKVRGCRPSKDLPGTCRHYKRREAIERWHITSVSQTVNTTWTQLEIIKDINRRPNILLYIARYNQNYVSQYSKPFLKQEIK